MFRHCVRMKLPSEKFTFRKRRFTMNDINLFLDICDEI